MVAQVCHSLAWALMKQSLVESAAAIEQYFERAVTLRRAAEEPLLVAESLNGRGHFFHQLGRKEAGDRPDCYLLARETIAESIALRASEPRYAWSVELAQSLTSLGNLQRDMDSPCLSAGTCLAAYERYAATVGPYHPRTQTALECMWRSYKDMDSAACALAVLASLTNVQAALGTSSTAYEKTLAEFNELNTMPRPWREQKGRRRSRYSNPEMFAQKGVAASVAHIGLERDTRIGGPVEAPRRRQRPIRLSLEDFGRLGKSEPSPNSPLGRIAKLTVTDSQIPGRVSPGAARKSASFRASFSNTASDAGSSSASSGPPGSARPNSPNLAGRGSPLIQASPTLQRRGATGAEVVASGSRLSGERPPPSPSSGASRPPPISIPEMAGGGLGGGGGQRSVQRRHSGSSLPLLPTAQEVADEGVDGVSPLVPVRPPQVRRAKSTNLVPHVTFNEERTPSPESIAIGAASVLRPSLKPTSRMESFLRRPWCEELCSRCLRGDYLRQPEALRLSLFERYPELSFFVGLTLEGDGTLSDRVESLQEQVITSMILACNLSALAHTEVEEAGSSPTESSVPIEMTTAYKPLLELSNAAVPSADALHIVLLLLLLRSLHRIALLVHDAGARVDELTTIGAAELVEAISACHGLSIPSLEGLAAEPADAEVHSTVLAIIGCPLRFDRFVLGEICTAAHLAPLYELSEMVGILPARQLLYVSCLGDLANMIAPALHTVVPAAWPAELNPLPPSTATAPPATEAPTGGTDSPHKDRSRSRSPKMAGSSRQASGELDGNSRQLKESSAAKAFLSLVCTAVSATGLLPDDMGDEEEADALLSGMEPNDDDFDALARGRKAARTFIREASKLMGGMCILGDPIHSSVPGVSVLCVRLCCMLRGRPNAAKHVEAALDLLNRADVAVLSREMEIDSPDQSERPIVLLETGAVVRACDEKASESDFFTSSGNSPRGARSSRRGSGDSASNSGFYGSSIVDAIKKLDVNPAPAAGATDEHFAGQLAKLDESRVRALQVALSCVADLYRIGRSAMLSVQRSSTLINDDFECRPFELFCGNVLRVVMTQGRSAPEPEPSTATEPQGRRMSRSGSRSNLANELRLSRVASFASSEGFETAAETRVTAPSTSELLQAASFGVLRATSDYAHLAIEAPGTKGGGDGLHTDSDDLLARLKSAIATELEAAANEGITEPQPLLIVSATGDAFAGDELALVLTRTLADLNLIDLRGVILPPTGAPLARGVLDTLGVTAPVAVGSDLEASRDSSPLSPFARQSREATHATVLTATPKHLVKRHESMGSMAGDLAAPSAAYFPDTPGAQAGVDFLTKEADGGTASDILLREFENAADASLTLLVTTSLTDIAHFIKLHKQLFGRVARRVVLLGDVEAASLGQQTNISQQESPKGKRRARVKSGDVVDDYLRPDETSPSFKQDHPAASYVFRACQELHVQIVVLTQRTTSAVPLPSFVYDELATLGHPVALRLRESQRASMQSLWHRANLPQGHALRRGLSGDRQWFARTFCGDADLSAVTQERHIWPYICEFTFLDPLALLACHPATLEAFYAVTVKAVQGVEHMVIGASSNERPGVRDCAKLRSFVLDGCRHALAASLEDAKGTTSSSSKPTPAGDSKSSTPGVRTRRRSGGFKDLKEHLLGPERFPTNS